MFSVYKFYKIILEDESTFPLILQPPDFYVTHNYIISLRRLQQVLSRVLIPTELAIIRISAHRTSCTLNLHPKLQMGVRRNRHDDVAWLYHHAGRFWCAPALARRFL